MRSLMMAVLSAVLAICIASSDSLATVREVPYQLQLDPRVVALEPGRIAEFPFTLELMPGSALGGVRVGALSDFRETGFAVAPGKSDRTRDLTLSGVALSADATVEFEIEVDGEVHVELVDFSALSPRELRPLAPGETVVDSVDPATAASLWRPEPSLVIEHVPGSANKYDIHAYGRFVYWRPVDGSMGATSVLVGVDGAEVHLIDEDGFDNTLATTTTDANGYFDIVVGWGGDLFDNEPDLTIKFDSGNSTTQVGPNSITTRYNWRTPVRENYTGTELNVGTFVVSGMNAQPLHILSTLVRAYRWYADNGVTLPGTAAHWPDGSWSYYTSWNNTLHFLPAHSLSERTIAHELGHHYVNHFSSSAGPDYCNGYCDDPDDCGHCGWCEENVNDAYGEGFPNFIAYATLEDLNAIYTPMPFSYSADMYERYALCGQDTTLASAPLTENALAAVLRDLHDDDVDSETAWISGVRDEIQMPLDDLLMFSQTMIGTSSTSYLGRALSYMQSSLDYDSEDVADFWAVTQMNGFGMDTAPPTNPTNIFSVTHTAGVSSPNNFPSMVWTASSDAASGVSHYLVSFTPGGPGAAVLDNGRATTFTTPTPMPPGNFWFNVQAVDNAGFTSATNSFGPIVIGSGSIDFQPYVPEFWPSPAVPTLGTVPGTPPPPVALSGAINNSYAQFSWKNASLTGASVLGFSTTVEIDGIQVATRAIPAQTIVGNQTFTDQNVGPFTVRGGRHMFVCTADGGYQRGESVENNNWAGGQYVWTPVTLTANSPIVAVAPRSRTGGWNKIPGTFFNCDAYRFTQAGWWNAVTMEASSDSDYSLSLHNASTGATNGFSSALGFSGRPIGAIEAVFTNRNNVGGASTAFDVGIYNQNDGSSSYTIRHTTSTEVAYGSSFTINWSGTERIALREFLVAPGDVGPLSPEIQLSDPSEGPVRMLLLDDGFTTGDVYDYSAIAITDESGYAQLNLNLTDSGYYCLVLHRDPPGYVAKRGALDVDVQLAPTLTNLEPRFDATGWAAPLVPRAAPDGTIGSVPLPAVLPGDVSSTYYNVAMINDSAIDAPSAIRISVDRDGIPGYWVQPAFLDAGNSFLFNSTSAWSVPAGRHTLTMTVDSLDGHTEASETDNVYGAQYVWEPKTLPFGPVSSRSAPSDPFAGLETIAITVIEETPEPGLDGGGISISPMVWPNCDGVRSPQFVPQGEDGYWAGFALMSRSASNADLRLHTISTGATKGFEEDLAQSNWGVGHSDFVFANLNYSQPNIFDAGILGSGGTQPYDIQLISSTFLDADPEGSYGAFSIPSQEIVALHELYLTQGVRVISLTNQTPGTRLGFSLYGPLNSREQPYFGKSDATAPDAISWLVHGGPLQYITVDIGQGGDDYYCLAVWKAESGALASQADYSLDFHSGATASDEANVARNPFVGVHPNPFNPRTTVVYELNRDSRVSLELYDLRGARVRSIGLGEQPAGRHEYSLDAIDQGGAPLASGRYVVQLMIDDRRYRKAITLLK